MKKLIILFLFPISYFLFPAAPTAQAVSEFTTSYHSLYTIKSSGPTTVVHTITLQNNLSHIYATDYSLATSGDHLEEIVASDESGEIPSSTTVQNGVTTIRLKIDHPAIGKDQVKTLTLAYQTDDVVERIGDTTTINIPRLARANEAQKYVRVVRLEKEADNPSLIYPPQSKTEPDESYTSYTFDGHQNESLTLLFGSSVTYKLNLTYELKNKELSAIDSELALPPDTPYQQVVLSSITPPPIRIDLDDNGNWLARYHLSPQEKLLVQTELFITVSPIPLHYDPSVTSFQKTPRSKYFDTSSASIVDLANRLKTPSNIYEYLVNNFTYNYGDISAASRKGALASINSPSFVLCTEFTDTFVSLARSLEIPSREINGYGYTKNSILQPQNIQTDILHSWPEYFSSDQKKWVSVDPTWGNTTGGIDYFNKLDFSHIAFVRHGSEDSYPLPAGAYKSNPKDKYVQVEIAKNIPTIDNSFEIRDNVVYNTGNVALINDVVGYLPPYGQYQINSAQSPSSWSKIKRFLIQLATWAHIR
jgi:transglutaminase-like putative cysteine protease